MYCIYRTAREAFEDDCEECHELAIIPHFPPFRGILREGGGREAKQGDMALVCSSFKELRKTVSGHEPGWNIGNS